MPNRSRASKDTIALTVLALLCEQPRHPYEIQRVIQERHKAWAMGRTRSLYHAVDRLLADGLIEPVETSREGKRPERTVYRITEEGREEYTAWLSELIYEPVADEHPYFLVALSFLATLPMPAALDALKVRAIALEGQVAGVEVWQRALRSDLRLPRPVVIEVEYFLAVRQAELAWVRSVVADIENGKLRWSEESLRAHFEAARGRAPEKEGAQ
jgi:DNA-binding PadR family transcriptional regulator